MSELDRYNIDIFKLSNSKHEYSFDYNEKFWAAFEEPIVEKGNGTAQVVLDKSESFIKMTIAIQGDVELICDRSLDTFSYDIDTARSIIYKYGEEEQEIDDEVAMITRDTQRINVAQLIYEFIGVEIPMKKLHPRFGDEDSGDEIVYIDQAEDDDAADASTTDPRWEALKKLKKN